MRALIILFVCLLAGCVVNPGSERPKYVASTPESAQEQSQPTPWLNPLAQISVQQRLSTPAGLDIRQARYFVEAEDSAPSVLLRLRDYSTASDGKPDPQRCELVRIDEGTSESVALAADVLPIELLLSADRRAWVMSGIKAADGSSVEASPVCLSASNAGFNGVEFAAEQRMLPLGFLDSQTLLLRPVKAVQVDNGLVAPSLDWDAPALRLNLGSPEPEEDQLGLFSPSSSSGSLAGFAISYKPVLPSQASIVYLVSAGGTAQPRNLAQFSYHVSYSAFAWQPPLLWVSTEKLATIQFLPDATGVSTRPNHNGLFRLVTINTSNGELALVEDHLPPGVAVAAGNGVLFYTRQQFAGETARWELWAASEDGLLKQRLWRPDEDTVYLSVEDAFDGSRLLVHRQYFRLSGQQPQLISELQEFGLAELSGGETKLGIQPLTSPQPLAAEGDLMEPEASEGLPPLSIPD